MSGLPLISIVVLSIDRAARLEDTLRSLAEQDYAHLNVLVQDCGSLDGSVEVARGFVRRYPTTFQLDEKRGSAPAMALEHALSAAHGDINAVMFPGDTLLPSALVRVSKEVDPRAGRLIVYGDSVIAGEGLLSANVRFPAQYTSRFEYLAMWKSRINTLPRPSVFWHRSVWEGARPQLEASPCALDYELYCSLGERVPFHKVDEVWSSICLCSEQGEEAEMLEHLVSASRRHWGPWYSPLRWRCEASYRVFLGHRHEHACHHARRVEDALKRGQRRQALRGGLMALLYSPAMAWGRLVRPWLGRKVGSHK